MCENFPRGLGEKRAPFHPGDYSRKIVILFTFPSIVHTNTEQNKVLAQILNFQGFELELILFNEQVNVYSDDEKNRDLPIGIVDVHKTTWRK